MIDFVSSSQTKQDIFVVNELSFKKDGCFVDFGAANGKDISNTYSLEKQLGWTGIVAEPCKAWQESLKANRTCHIELNCVWTETGKTMLFNQTDVADLSTIDQFSSCDMWADARSTGYRYEVQTISLMDLLEKYHMPFMIDYLSIDTEGSEYEILKAFDFDRYCFRIITVEHNYTPARHQLYDLLTSKGYVRKYTQFSEQDDWYVFN